MRYARFEKMVAPARSYPALWRLALGFATTFVIAFLWMFGLIWLAGQVTDQSFLSTMSSIIQPPVPSPGVTALFLFLVVGIGLGAMISAQVWQKRSPGTLFGPAVRTLRHFTMAAGLALGAMLLVAIPFLLFIDRPVLNMGLGTWLFWLPLGLAVVAAQTGAEEVFFRGYLQTQLGARFKSPLLWLVAPALVFGAIHFQPGMPDHLIWTVLIVATVFGLLAGDLTARTGSIGAAWGFHFANNTFVLMIVATEASQITGLGLFRTDTPLDDLSAISPLIAVEILTLVAIWALIRRVLSS